MTGSHAIARAVPLALAVLLAACDASTAPARPSFLFGEFETVELSLDAQTGHPRVGLYPMRFDGEGNVLADLDGDRAFEPFAGYDVRPGLGIEIGAASTGVLNATGELLLTQALAGTPECCLRASVRVSRGTDTPLLRGRYLVSMLESDAAGGCRTRLIAATVDDPGRMDWTVIADSEGAPGSGSWTVGVEDSRLGLGPLRGAVRFDGSVFFAAAADAQSKTVVAGVRRDPTVAGPLRGRYTGCYFVMDGRCAIGRFTLDGDDAGAALDGERSDGVEDHALLECSVNDAGLLTADGRWFGALSGDGEVFAGVDTDASNGRIAFYAGLRAGG